MGIEQEPFRRYHEKKQADSFTVRLNEQERAILESSKKIIEQEKDSTALKQLALIGANVIHEKKIMGLLGVVFKNKRNNKRLGIITYDALNEQM